MSSNSTPLVASNYHMHSKYDDGQGELADYVRAALDLGMTSIGFSGHAPVPFATSWNIALDRLGAYRAEAEAARASHQHEIAVAVGLEVDVIPGLEGHFQQHIVPLGFDYFIGSVHFVGNDPHTGIPWEIDEGPDEVRRGLEDWYGNDIRRLVEDFYALERRVPRYLPALAIVGHMDRIKRFNYGDQFFSETAPWYRDAVDATLETYAQEDIIVELNTAGWRTPTGAAYPSDWITRRCHERGIRMTLNTDAHTTAHLAADHARGLAQLQTAGYHAISIWRDGAWVEQGLPVT